MKKSIFNKNLIAFSLAEMMIVMGVVAVFFAVTYPTYTKVKKVSPEPPLKARFECYRDTSGNICQRQVRHGKEVSNNCTGLAYCTFLAPHMIQNMQVHMIGAGGKNYGSNGEFYTDVIRLDKNEYKIIPGKASAGAGSSDRNSTIEYGTDMIYSAAGGSDATANGANLKSITFYSKTAKSPLAYISSGSAVDFTLGDNVCSIDASGLVFNKISESQFVSEPFTCSALSVSALLWTYKDGYTQKRNNVETTAMTNYLNLSGSDITAAGESSTSSGSNGNNGAVVISW